MRVFTVARTEGLERVLSTVIQNGMRQGWIDLGHRDSEIKTLLDNLPGQPFALRRLDGSDNETLESFSASVEDDSDSGQKKATAVLKDIRKAEPLNPGLNALESLARAHTIHARTEPPSHPEPVLEDDDVSARPS